MKITLTNTTRPKQPRFIARMHATTALATTLLCGSVMLPHAAEAQEGSTLSHSYRTSDSSWAAVFDPAALGSQYLTTTQNARRADDTLDSPRVAGYRVSFDTAGTYDLYMRAKARGGSAGISYNSNFGTDINWAGVGGNDLEQDGFGWVNLSQVRRGSTLTVEAPDTLLFSIASRRSGIHIDAFAFGTTGTTFTDEELDAAVVGNAAQSGLIGFQAQYPHNLGQDTISDAGLHVAKIFTDRLFELRAELERQLPTTDQAKVAAWRAAIEAEAPFAKEAAATASAVRSMQEADRDLQRRERVYSLGPATLENAQARVAKAKAMAGDDPEREAAITEAERLLRLRQRDVNGAERGVTQARERAEEAQKNLPEAIKQAEAAKQAHDRAMAAVMQAMDDLGVSEVLGSDQLDAMLAEYMVLLTATPRELAKFAVQSTENANLVRQLLGDTELMIQMLVADGPNGGNYGEAVKIYAGIQQASPRAREGVFQRLALAVSLGHAGGIQERDQSAVADPVSRYLNYEQAYLAGELVSGFDDLCAWSLVMVVNGADCDETMDWGRKMLNNLRPDCIPANGNTTLTADFIDNEIPYNAAGPNNDHSDVRFMHNILANGGICGRRAFFGRFLLRSVGVPTTARSEPGHATLAHWHPDGWQTRLGGNWGPGNRGRYATMNRTRSSPYGVDLNFLETTQARQHADAYIRVKRAQWIGTLVGEQAKPGFHSRDDDSNEEEPSFWNDLALHEQRRIIAWLDANRGEASVAAAAPAPRATGMITVDANGVITIPSAATSSPTETVARIFKHHQPEILFFVEDRAGNTRLHTSRYVNEFDTFTYTFDAPRAGTYQIAARVATARPNTQLHASANGSDSIEMPLPYTIGMWETSAPAEINLAAGRNELTFQGRRIAIDQFTLTPVR